MRQRLPIVLSTTALVVALFGSTPIGHAAQHAIVAVIPPFAKTADYAKNAGNSALLNGRKSTLSGAPGTIPVVGANGKLPTSIGAVGPQGTQGPKGDPGLSGVNIVQASRTYPIPADSSSNAVANCPSGEVALGGGGLVQQFSSNAFLDATPIAGAQPETSGYVATAAAVSTPAGGHITVIAWAVCAKVATTSS